MNAPFLNKSQTPDPQFVRIDGQDWFAGRLTGYFTTAAGKAATVLTLASAFTAAADGWQNGFAFGGVSLTFAICSYGLSKLHDYAILKSVPVGGGHLLGYAIDRSGRARPPENEAMLLEQTRVVLKHSAIVASAIGAFTAIMWVPFFIPHIAALKDYPAYAAALAMSASVLPTYFITHYAGMARRASRLLGQPPEYRFCGNPPLYQPENVAQAVPNGIPATNFRLTL